jgi:NADH-quinone oxidoreductase subunit L
MDMISSFLYKIVDLGIIDKIINGIPRLTNAASSGLRLVQTGSLGFYLVAMVAGMIAMFVFKMLM